MDSGFFSPDLLQGAKTDVVFFLVGCFVVWLAGIVHV
jgi:hypothetical protein